MGRTTIARGIVMVALAAASLAPATSSATPSGCMGSSMLPYVCEFSYAGGSVHVAAVAVPPQYEVAAHAELRAGDGTILLSCNESGACARVAEAPASLAVGDPLFCTGAATFSCGSSG